MRKILRGYLIVALAAVAATHWADALRYDRTLVQAGEFWRLVTAPLVHVNGAHLLMNLLGFGMVLALAPMQFRRVLGSLLPLGVGVFALEHLMLSHAWACGLSGSLHGAVMLLALAPGASRPIQVLGVAAVLKVGGEMLCGESASSAMLGTTVLVQHHFLGVCLGAALGMGLKLRDYTRGHQQPPEPTS